MADVPSVTTLQVSHPVILRILMKTDDPALHRVIVILVIFGDRDVIFEDSRRDSIIKSLVDGEIG